MLSEFRTPVATAFSIQSKILLVNPFYEIYQGTLILDGTKLFVQGSGKYFAASIPHGVTCV
jgi:hypothetical protein